MPTEIDNEWKNNFSNSQALYEYFSKPVLATNILKSLAEAGETSFTRQQIEDAIDSILQPIEFGNINHVPHFPVDGSNTSTYPEASAQTPLKAFRIATNSSVRKPRVVITAGIHARELAPPQAVARYFSAMLSSYLTSRLLKVSKGFPITHRGFYYKGSENHVYDSDQQDITKKSQTHENDRFYDAAFSNEIFIDGYNFTGVAELVDRLEIIVFPVCNPAGLDFVLTKVQESEEDALIRVNWRKNRASLKFDSVPLANEGGTALDRREYEDEEQGKDMFAIGVDLNRNADICWYYPLYYSADYLKEKLHSCSRNPYHHVEYIGANPNSELETRAILSALMSDIDHMATSFPSQLAPTTTNGPIVVVENETGFPIPIDTTPDPDTTSDDIDYLEAGKPASLYKDYLFYLDIHSHSRLIMVPWSMETLTQITDSTASGRPTYLNPDFNQKRDGVSKLTLPERGKMNVTGISGKMGLGDERMFITKETLAKRGDDYQEGFPTHLSFANNTKKDSSELIVHNLLVTQIEDFAKTMKTSITRALTAGVDPSYTKRIERRCTYKIMQAPGLYTLTGSPMDYAFSLNIRDIVGFGTNQPLPPTLPPITKPMNPQRTGPVITLAIEVGHEDEHGFFPLDKLPEPNPSQKPYIKFHTDIKGAYPKVERETFAAIHAFLQQSLQYFDKQFEVKK